MLCDDTDVHVLVLGAVFVLAVHFVLLVQDLAEDEVVPVAKVHAMVRLDEVIKRPNMVQIVIEQASRREAEYVDHIYLILVRLLDLLVQLQHHLVFGAACPVQTRRVLALLYHVTLDIVQ